MPRHFPFWLLLALIVVIGMFFWQVIRPFVLAIFIAIVLAVLFAPLHQWLTNRIAQRRRVAAALTTFCILVSVILPISFTMLMAGTQLMTLGKKAVVWLDQQPRPGLEKALKEVEQTKVGALIQDAYLHLPDDQREQIRKSGSRIAEAATSELYNKTRDFLSDVIAFIISFVVMTIALYYFLADRDLFLRELHRLQPLDLREERLLEDKFQCVCRGVVLGTIIAGIVQATLAGIAFAIIGVPQIWLLMVLTMFFSFIPFLGAAAVWLPVSLLLIANQNYVAGIGLMIFGGAVVSTTDNIIRAYVVGSQARLHPLIALVTALGAIQVVGLWGIFIGPMVAAFLYALLNMIQERIEQGSEISKQESKLSQVN